MAEKVIGVLGGLGPWATLDLFEKILRLSPARRDQDHLRIIIDNNPKIPDRSPAILGDGEDPTPALVATARNLQRAGADFIVIPCNTAHAFYDQVAAAVEIPVLHIMKEVARAARTAEAELRRVGLLATKATVESRLYAQAFEQIGVEVLAPDNAGQEVVNRAIYGVKAGQMGEDITAELTTVARRLIDRGAQAIVLGCTELPYVLRPGQVPVSLLDSNLILAEAAIRAAKQPSEVLSRSR